ncbi:MAG: NusG domain II-containing protein [Lachnospiraceae bacterium]|nr:NusG domain II-containing protein [Lachnospiraceae bacterium]
MEQKGKLKNDLILVTVLLLVAVITFFAMKVYQKQTTNHAMVVVSVDGKEWGRYPLNKNCKKVISLSDGQYNELTIKDGYADMTDATCPDKICVHHKKISKNGETLVCLPHKVVVEIESEEESNVDGSTN